jgi:endoglucanase
MVRRAPGGLVGLLATLALAGCGVLAATSGPAPLRHTALPQHHEARIHQRHTRPAPHPKPRPTAPLLPLAPAHGTLPGWLHTAGTTIVDAHDRPVRLASVNWDGAETTNFVVGGLAERPYMSILRSIKGLGFNSIRILFSNELVERNPVVRRHLTANPHLRGKRALEILDTIVAGARQVGLMVILVDHRNAAGGKGHQFTHSSVLWYSLPRYPEQVWIADWLKLARRYRNNPAVVGFDLFNEPHNDGPGLEILSMGYLHQGATWGPFLGQDNLATDWRLAAQRAGNAILRVNPHVLIIVEGTEIYPYRNPLSGPACPDHTPASWGYCADVYWWGGNLAGVKNYPVVLNVPHQLVYSPHEYGPGLHTQRWFTSMRSEADWQRKEYVHWGYLIDAKGPSAAPVWVGEFGTATSGPASNVHDPRNRLQQSWFNALIHYLQRHPTIGWAYWVLNGTRPEGPDRIPGLPNGPGLLTRDWAHLSNPRVFALLHTLMPK